MANVINIDKTKLHPLLVYKLTVFLNKCENAGIDNVLVYCGYRSFKEQNDLYAQGRTKAGNVITNAKGGYSQHNFGIAIDFCKNTKAGAFSDSVWYNKVAKIAKSVGLGWGGDWKSFKDMPHLYLKTWGSDTSKLRNLYGSYDVFKKTWQATTLRKIRIFKGKALSTKVLVWSNKGTKLSLLYVSKFWWAKVATNNGTVGYVRKKYLSYIS